MAPMQLERLPRERPDTDPPDRRLPGEKGRTPVREPGPGPLDPQRLPEPDSETDLDDTGPLEPLKTTDSGARNRFRPTEVDEVD